MAGLLPIDRGLASRQASWFKAMAPTPGKERRLFYFEHTCPGLGLPEKGAFDDEVELDVDLGLEPRRRTVLGVERKVHRQTQSLLVHPGRASRLLDLADLEHRRHQASAGGIPVHHRPTLSAGRAPRPRRRADALPVHVRGAQIRWAQLDDRERD